MTEQKGARRKIAIVTGGLRNLGLDLSKALLSHGYHVIATTRDLTRCSELSSSESGIEAMEVDIGSEAGVDALFRRVQRMDIPLEVLVNNASSFPKGPLLSFSPEEVMNAFRSSPISAFMCSRLSVPLMKKAGRGRIVNIGMAGCDKARAFNAVAAHASAKMALSVLTLSMAREVDGSVVTVNQVNPGPIERPSMDQEEVYRLTSLSPTGRLVSASDVVCKVLELVFSDANGTMVEVI